MVSGLLLEQDVACSLCHALVKYVLMTRSMYQRGRQSASRHVQYQPLGQRSQSYRRIRGGRECPAEEPEQAAGRRWRLGVALSDEKR